MSLAGSSPGRAGWLDEFHPFSALHLLTLVALSAVVCAVTLAGRRSRVRRGGAGGARFDKAVAASGALAWIVVQVWWLAPGRFAWEKSLPLQLCDLAGVVGPVAMWTSGRRARALLYFWGLGLSTQGLLTPLIERGPAHAAFWMTFLNHGAILTMAVYDLAVRRYRPSWRDLGFALALTLAYAACMFTLDAMLGWNYAYLGRATPGVPTVIEALGPWPGRAVAIMALGALAMTLLMLPWRLVARRHAAGGEKSGEEHDGVRP